MHVRHPASAVRPTLRTNRSRVRWTDPKSSRPAWPALAVVDEAVQVTLAHLEELGRFARARPLVRRHGRQPRAFHVSEQEGSHGVALVGTGVSCPIGLGA